MLSPQTGLRNTFLIYFLSYRLAKTLCSNQRIATKWAIKCKADQSKLLQITLVPQVLFSFFSVVFDIDTLSKTLFKQFQNL